MIKPEDFYKEEDHPSPQSVQRMWKGIEREVASHTRAFLFIPDRRSFLYGIAASLVIYFAGAGVIATVRNTMADSQPDAVRLDAVYRSAIEQFEEVAPRIISHTSDNQRVTDYVTTRKEQLHKIDLAIGELQGETRHGDLSPLKQKRLRQLYSLKLNVLQEMIENGEIDV